ncbi:MAG: helix-turn-helix domain-containing protein [Solirubrobacterales bacterium]
MYLTRRHTDLSLPRIAREFNRRDHTTVMHALKRVESRLQTEPAMTQTLDQLSTALAS